MVGITAVMLTLFFTFLAVYLMIVLIAAPDPIGPSYEDETTTTTTTVTTVTEQPAAPAAEAPAYDIVGTLPIRHDTDKPYVVDPGDGATIHVNPTDDLYRDAHGRVWRLA